MFGADSVVTPFPTSIGGQPPSPLSVQHLPAAENIPISHEAENIAIHGLQRPAARLVPGGKFICPKTDVASLYIRSPQSAVKWFGFFGQRSAFFG